MGSDSLGACALEMRKQKKKRKKIPLWLRKAIRYWKQGNDIWENCMRRALKQDVIKPEEICFK